MMPTFTNLVASLLRSVKTWPLLSAGMFPMYSERKQTQFSLHCNSPMISHDLTVVGASFLQLTLAFYILPLSQ